MLGFVQNLFRPRGNPIGIDFGTDCLRLAQVQYIEGDHRLIAAASAPVPIGVRNDPAGRLAFFSQMIPKLISRASFQGRHAVLCLPASTMHIKHLRLNRMDEAALRKAIPTEARDILPLDPSQAMIRHLIAGEIYQEEEPKFEIIVMAAAKQWVQQYLNAARNSRLHIANMNVEPIAIVDCFRHVYRRKLDAEVTLCFIDIGANSTRAVIARHGQMLFARSIPIGGSHFTHAVARELGVNFEDAENLRVKLSAIAPVQSAIAEKQVITTKRDLFSESRAPVSIEEAYGGALASSPASAPEPAAAATTSLLEAPSAAEPDREPSADEISRVQQACQETLRQLVDELDSCRRYYESTFPEKPVERLIFIGGEARQRHLCQQIAQKLNIPAQVGDPLCRMGRISDIKIESGIDRRLPQPNWVVAIGLSMGPANQIRTPHAFESDC